MIDLLLLAVVAVVLGGRFAWTKLQAFKASKPSLPQPGPPVVAEVSPVSSTAPGVVAGCPYGVCPVSVPDESACENCSGNLQAAISEEDLKRLQLIRDIVAGKNRPVGDMTDTQRRALLRIYLQGGSAMDAVAFLRDRDTGKAAPLTADIPPSK